MANEITASTALQVVNGSLKDYFPFESKLITQTTQWSLRDTLSIPTTAGGTAITTTGITALGWCYVRNLDGTNYVTIGPDSGGSIVSFIKLKPGEFCIFRLQTGITIRALANTSAVKILIGIFDD